MSADLQQRCDDAARLIEAADGLMITAGAGLGVDSGLPDFRGNTGFWRAYPALADARIARGLAALFNPVLYPGTNRLLQISQEELGYLAGVSRQRANQGLKVLEDAGLVRSEYGGINVLDLDGLRTFGD